MRSRKKCASTEPGNNRIAFAVGNWYDFVRHFCTKGDQGARLRSQWLANRWAVKWPVKYEFSAAVGIRCWFG